MGGAGNRGIGGKLAIYRHVSIMLIATTKSIQPITLMTLLGDVTITIPRIISPVTMSIAGSMMAFSNGLKVLTPIVNNSIPRQ